MLAETVSLDGGTLLFVLVVLLLLLAVSVAVIFLGFVLASKAGRGSRTALGWWIVILVLEGLVSLRSLVGVFQDDAFSLSLLFLPTMMAAQVAMFFLSRDAG